VSNLLIKNYSFIIVKPSAYQQWIPGYSYFNAPYNAKLTSSGKEYVVARLKILGFTTVGFVSISLNQLVQAFDYPPIKPFPDYPIYYQCDFNSYLNTWVITFNKTNLYEFAKPVEYYPTLKTTVNSYFDTRPEGETVNVPGSYTTITPESYEKQVPIIGWNAGAISQSMFTSTGTASFSIALNSVGIFTGLCEQSIAVQDQRPERIKYAIYTHLGLYSIYVDNIQKTVDASYIASDVFKIVISKEIVSFYKNGLLLYSETKEDNNIIYVLDCSMYYSNDSILNASINASTTLDSYSSLISIQTHSGTLIQSGYSSILGSQRHTNSLSVYPNLVNLQNHIGNLLSLNYSSISGTQNHVSNLLNYASRIESKQVHTCTLLTKYGSIISGVQEHNSLLEAGGIVPTVPPILFGTQLHNGFMRNVYILPPQIFVIT